MAENFKRSQSSAVDKQTLSDLSAKPYAMQVTRPAPIQDSRL